MPHVRYAPLLAWLSVAACLAIFVDADRCSCNYADAQWREGLELSSNASSPLHLAAASGNVTGVKDAVLKGADVSAVVAGFTPLQAALLTTSDPYWHPYSEPAYQIMYILLTKGADPNIPFPVGTYVSQGGATPLHWAAYDGRAELVYQMVKAGGNVTAVTARTKGTPLHQAAKCDFRLSWDYRAAATAQVLLAFGASPNATNAQGQTPLASGPFSPGCAAANSDLSDCPRTCKVLQGGITPQQKAAILAGQVPNFEPEADKGLTPRCCKDDTSELGFSRCCT